MLHPELKGKYIAVCGSTEERHGIVLAKNQLAKTAGVKTGEAIWQAKQKCPQLTIVQPHMDQYLKFSKIVRDIYLRYSPEVESFGIDESWIELTGSARLRHESPADIANEIRETVKHEVGLTVSVGVSYNKIFAKLGSDMKKPDAVTEIWEDDFRRKVWPLPASDLLYVGRATTAKLNRYAIHTIGDLARTNPEFLREKLGINGEKLWTYANGLDTSRVMPCDFEPPIKSVGHGITCTADNTLAGREYQARLPYPTQSFLEIAQAGYDLFCRKHVWNNDIRSLTISGIDLVPDDSPMQLDLWEDYAKHCRKLALEKAIEDIRRRYGLDAISFASLITGLKIPGNREVEYKMPSKMYQ